MKRKQLLVLFMFTCALAMLLVVSYIPSVHASTTTTIYITASANDGYVCGSSSSYSKAHGTATGSDNSGYYVVIGQQWSGSSYSVYRDFLKFDTSSIPVGSTINSAKLGFRLGYDGVGYNDTDFYLNLQKWTGDTPIDTGDYNSFDGTNYDNGALYSGSLDDIHYNNFTISNFNLITKGGNTLVCIRSARDISSTQPSGDEYFGIVAYDFFSSWAPILEVTYTTPTVSITITSSPTGSGYVTVDGGAITTPKTYSWNPGDSHTIAANSPVSGTNLKYYWTSWSDSGAQSHSYTVPGSGATVTANYKTAYLCTVSSSYGSPTITLNSGTNEGGGYYDSGSSLTCSVTSPASGGSGVQYLVGSYTGTGSAPSGSGASTGAFTITAYSTVTWGAWTTQYYLTVAGGDSPSGQGWYNSGATTTVTDYWVWNSVTGQSRTALTNYVLDNTAQNPARSNTGNYTTPTITMSTYHNATFTSVTQYYLSLVTATSSVGQSGSQTSDAWYDSGTSASISATTPYSNSTATFVFLKWAWTRGGVAQANSTDNPFVITMSSYVTATAYWNALPSIGQFQSPATAYANQYFFVNATVYDADGLTDLYNVSVQITGAVVCAWVNSTNTFSIQSDASHYCVLNATASTRVTVNSTAYTVAWKIKLCWNYTEGSVDVNGTVYDMEGGTGAGSKSGLFTFEHNLGVASASVNVVRVNPSSAVIFTGQIYYQGTSTSPEDVSGITGYVSLNGTNMGSNSSLSSGGQFKVTVTSEASIGTYTYSLYSVTLGGASTTNQTRSFVVETVTITFNGPFRINVGTNCSALTVSGNYTTDNSVFDGTITLNDTTFSHITVGRRDFRVLSISGGSYGITALANNPTTYCIWEGLNVTIVANWTNPNAGRYVSFNMTVSYLSDNSNVTVFTVNILRGSAHFASSPTFTDHSDSVVTHLYTIENITDSTYGITAFTSNTVTVVWVNLFVEVDQINAGNLDINVNSSSLSLYHCRWSSNQTSCTDGTIYVNGTGFSINSTGWASVSFNFSTVGLRVLNLTGASVEGVTAFGQLPANPQIVWNRVLIASGGVTSSYMHVGSSASVYYTVEYEYDNSSITDGVVLLNGTAMTFDATLNRWEKDITPSIGYNIYFVSSVSGNSHGITVINNVRGFVNCTVYVNLNIRTVDVNGNALTQAVVYMNNGTSATIPPGLPFGTGIAIVGASSWFSQTVNPVGWTYWTGMTNATINVYVTWYGLTVNSTFTFTMTGDTTIDAVCLCYPFTVSGTRFWAASNATITSAIYALNILTLQFTGPNDTYLLTSSCTSLPKYLTNVIYDLSADFTLGYLRVPHFGNATIKLSYENWGDTCIMATDKLISSASLVANNLTAFFTGNPGDIGTVKVFCGTRGSPVDVAGFTTTSYTSGVLTGIYNFPNSSFGVWIGWTTYGGSGPSNPTVANLIISIDLGFPAQAQPGQVLEGTLNVTWSGSSTIYLWSVACGDVYADWLLNVPQGLPLSMVASAQFESVPVTLTIPQNATVGTYQIPCIIVFANPQGTTKTFQTIVSFTLVAPSPGSSDIVTYIFLGLFGSIGVGVFFGGNEVRKRRRLVQTV